MHLLLNLCLDRELRPSQPQQLPLLRLLELLVVEARYLQELFVLLRKQELHELLAADHGLHPGHGHDLVRVELLVLECCLYKHQNFLTELTVAVILLQSAKPEVERPLTYQLRYLDHAPVYADQHIVLAEITL